MTAEAIQKGELKLKRQWWPRFPKQMETLCFVNITTCTMSKTQEKGRGKDVASILLSLSPEAEAEGTNVTGQELT